MNDAPPIFVLGAGGHAKVVVATLQAGGYHVESLFDDDPDKANEKMLGCPVTGTLADFANDPLKRGQAIIAIGDNRRRFEIAQRFPGARWLTLVHPRADVHSSVRLGPGTVVFSGAVIQPGASTGSHCIVNTSATIDHDSTLSNFVHVAPGANLGGDVRLEEGVLLGLGAGVNLGSTVGQWSTVGAGAIVVKDLRPGVIAVGVPARPVTIEELHEATDSDGVTGP